MIPKNAVNIRDEAQGLANALDKYEEYCSWLLSRNTVLAVISAYVKLKSAQSTINSIMSGRTVSDFEVSLRDIFGLDQSSWDGFLSSAANVHVTLVPALFAAIEAAESNLLAQSFGVDGIPAPTGTLSAGEANAIRSAAQAVVAEYA